MNRPVRVLAIDGGGIRGLIPAILLASLERTAGRPVHRLFDVIAGTSTGGILACALAAFAPHPAPALVDLYVRHGRDIFAPSPWRSVVSAVGGPKHDHRPLEDVLYRTFGNGMLSEARTNLLVPAYDIEAREAKFFKSWRARGELNPPGEVPADADFRLRDVARATSAAPSYFEPAQVSSLSGRRVACVDGALAANNPAMCAVASARRLYPGAPGMVVLSLGAGEAAEPIRHAQARTWGALAWARPVLGCLMDGMSDTVDYQVKECFGDEVRYFRLQAGLRGPNAPSDAIDDASAENIRRLVLCGQALAQERAADLAALVPSLVA